MRNPVKQGVRPVGGFHPGEKKPGLRYRKPRLLLREKTEVTVFSQSHVLPARLTGGVQLSLATPVLRRGMPRR